MASQTMKQVQQLEAVWEQRFSLPQPLNKPFNSGFGEEVLNFIEQWRMKAKELSDAEIVKQAADGIIIEGNQLGQHYESQWIARQLKTVQPKDPKEIYGPVLDATIYSFLSEVNRIRFINVSILEYKPPRCTTMGQLLFLLFQTDAADQALIIKEKFELATGTILFSTSSENRCLEYLQLNATKNFLIIRCGNDLPETISNLAKYFPQIYAIYLFCVNSFLDNSGKIRGVFENENNLFYQLTNDVIDYYTHEADVYMRLAQHELSRDKYQEALKWATILDQNLKYSL
ncbi:unnamed protein product [Didymodactylos carnosus]|uniref:Uncharacterized protein n=1 Tax=Didymodactylos carnosus TaxID=1234261 RepID=A0A8S2JRB8_9BILA|nr:unnamed protein product [Didymodactylos carnosus]CAF3822394.1 unnamed protein product [Didymodactylos carnosus]